MHGVVTGGESPGSSSTPMLTRGRTANHVYVSVVGTGDPHTVIRPDNDVPPADRHRAARANPGPRRPTRNPPPPPSASNKTPPCRLRRRDRPLPRRPPTRRPEHVAGRQLAADLDHGANSLLNGLIEEPLWPTLRGDLLLLAAAPDLTSAHNQAGVAGSRIQDINEITTGGPLPWLPGIPHRITADHNWGPYLEARSRLVRTSPTRSASTPAGEVPAWAAKRYAPVSTELIADVQVWRAATQVDPGDPRPTGPPQLGRAARVWQQRLDERLAAADTRTDWHWRRLLASEVPRATADPFMPELAERLSNLIRAGFDATLLVRSAAAAGPLPDDYPAAALWWRILDQLPQTPNQDPATANAAAPTRQKTTPSLDRLRTRPRSAPPPAHGPSR